MNYGTYVTEHWQADSEQARLVAQVGAMYEQRGLIEGDETPPLRTACVCGSECWRDAPENEWATREPGISLPFVGRDYGAERMMIAAINFVDWGGLWGNWQIREGQLDALREGKRKVHGSDLPYAAGAFAHAIRTGITGQEIAPDPLCPPDEAAEALEQCSFTQSVKCSPAPARHRSEPYYPMELNCPREYLLDEIRMLRPAVLILLGQMPADRLRTLTRSSRWQNLPDLDHGYLELGETSVEVFGLHHPSYRGWRRSYRALATRFAALDRK